jgi:phosphohistidine swiveling domain-containing protein
LNNYNKNHPIIVGLAGKALTGKTSVADTIVPKARISIEGEGMAWDHIYFALPLYELASIKKNVTGNRSRIRQLYGIHETIYDIFGKSPIANVPEYEEMFRIVNEIYSMPLPTDGSKPRSFLQKAGDICRSHNQTCFSEWAINKSKSLYHDYLRDFAFDDDVPPFSVIISDVRYVNEAEAIKNSPNGVLVCYTASDSVREERMIRRDGALMTEEQRNHSSELQMDAVADISDIVIDTDNLTIEQQASITKDFIKGMVFSNA